MENFLKRISFPQFCLVMSLAALVPSIILSFLSNYIAVLLFGDISQYSPPKIVISFSSLFGTIVFAPVVETLMLGGIIYFLRKFFLNRILICFISGIIFGALHGSVGILWFFGTFWSFIVFSYAFLFWTEDDNLKALLAACIPHMLLNSFACFIVFLTQYL
jgi:membrane protease YdiL (CAAX protease family)